MTTLTDILIKLFQLIMIFGPIIIVLCSIIIITIVLIHFFSYYNDYMYAAKYNKIDFSVIKPGMTKKQILKIIKLKPKFKNEYAFIYTCIQKINSNYKVKEKVIIFKDDVVTRIEESTQTSYSKR